MTYELGIDLGTTYTAAAVHRDGLASICSLGGRAATIPSVVLLRSDGTFLTGDAAERRAATEPERVVREFKRRLGDTTPIIVAGSPYSAEALTARLLAAVVTHVQEREGSSPKRIVVTHPANWGDYKTDLLSQAVRMAGLDEGQVDFITEPEAAAVSYASQERVEPGEVIAVYDLGGGTFDAAVLRRTNVGFSIVGKPEGIERLGGIDFDAAVFAHVTSALRSAIEELDPEDPAVLSAVARLRRDCVDAKEALSSDTDASVPIMLPGMQTDVRITRHEFESLIRPSLIDSIEAMKRAVRAASIELEQVSRILLIGGSSRIPVVGQLVASELGRSLAIDAHPKHTVAIGAAYAAAGRMESGRRPAATLSAPPRSQPRGSGALDANRTMVSSPKDLAPPSAEQIEKARSLFRPVAGTPPAAAKAPPVVGPPGGAGGSAEPAKARPVVGPPGGGAPPAAAKARPVVGPPGGAGGSAEPAKARPVATPPGGSAGPTQARPVKDGPRKARPVTNPGAAPGSGPPARAVPPAPAATPTPEKRPSDDSALTAVYRPPSGPERTSVYPGSGQVGPASGGHGGSAAQAAGGSPTKWIIAVLALLTLIVIIAVAIIRAGAT